jgi:dipeptidyl aminopeptidase/acylaminoacyl peptidase
MAAAEAGLAQPAGPPASAEAQRRLEDFARLPSMTRPAISPSGTAVAALVASGGETLLSIVPLDGSPRRTAQLGDVDVRWLRWVNDKWLAVGVGAEVKLEGAGSFYATRMLRVSADLSVRDIVPEGRSGFSADNLVWVASDGSARVLLARQSSIYWGIGAFPEVVAIDLDSGRKTTAAGAMVNVFGWAADDAGVVRAGIGRSSDGRNVRLLYRAGAEDKWETIDRANTRRGESITEPEMFLGGDGRALVLADTPEGMRGVFEVQLPSLELGKPLFVRPGFDVERVVSLPGLEEPAGFAVVEDTLRHHWIDADMAQVQRALDASVGTGRRATIRSVSRDRSRMIVLVDSASEPGRWFVLDRTAERMVPLGWINEAFRQPLHPVRTIRYKARDGLEIPAVLTTPRRPKAEGRLPLIVMPHGGPEARDSEDWDWWAQFLADRGYVVVQPNFRGSTGFGTPFRKAGEGQWGLAMQDDLNDAVSHLASEGLIDPKRVCMVGGSYGGYAAMRAAQRDGAMYRCAVSFAGVSDLVRMLLYDRGFLWGAARADALREHAPDLSGVSPLNFVDQVSIPVLLVHGQKDGRVPALQSRLFAERLARRGKPHRHVELPLGDHSLTREEDRLTFLKELETFLAAHNPA